MIWSLLNCVKKASVFSVGFLVAMLRWTKNKKINNPTIYKQYWSIQTCHNTLNSNNSILRFALILASLYRCSQKYETLFSHIFVRHYHSAVECSLSDFHNFTICQNQVFKVSLIISYSWGVIPPNAQPFRQISPRSR